MPSLSTTLRPIAAAAATLAAACLTGGELEHADHHHRELHGHAHGADDVGLRIGAVGAGHDQPGGLWVTIRNRLPMERSPEGRVISQMYLHAAWLTAIRGGGYDEGGHHHDGACSSCASKLRFRLSERVHAQEQETFFLSQQQASDLFQRNAGRLAVEIRDSARIGGAGYPCRESIRIDDPAKTPKQEVVVEVQERFATDYGCTLAVAPYRQQA